MQFFVAAAALAAGGPERPLIAAADGGIRASQIAFVPAERDRVVAKLPEGTGQVELTEAERAALLRSRYPGERYRLRHLGSLRVVRAGPKPAADAGVGCVATRVSVRAGAYLDQPDVEPASCQPGASSGWLGYDPQAKSFFARRDIPAGTGLGRIASLTPPATVAGSRAVYRTTDGPVTVEREVVALQSARDGARVFVRTESGEVLAASLMEEQP